MDVPGTENVESAANARWFATTHWTVVLNAQAADSPQAAQALEQLCRTYWYPLYACVRRRGHRPEDAQDLTQAFFARLLSSHFFADTNRAKGRFRSFLLGALMHFLHEEWRRSRRIKRGGGLTFLSLDGFDGEERYRVEPVDNLTPEKSFARNWALTLLDLVLGQLQAEFAAAGKPEEFASLRPYLLGEKSAPPYAEMADRLGTSEGAVKVKVYRLRQRYGELLREAIAHTVTRPEEIEDEISYLMAALGD